jgi:aspartyl-tRNA(Asn)/glutamyl-tRNA(Gln) amidotransferase subunit A
MSVDESLAKLNIREMADLIGQGKTSPVEIMTATLGRIERLNGDYRAFLSVYPEQAIAAAKKAEGELSSGQNRGPLHGVPLAVKDLFQVEGMDRTCGSSFLRDATATSDATSVARLRDAGAIIVGLLNLNEFAYGPTGINPHHGSARNPWNPDFACGGSSAGSGSAVAAALVPGALGTDTGGSIRLPASLCGVVGMKQSFGLASRHGIYPLNHSFDHGGPLARTVGDAAIMLQAIAGPDVEDATTEGAQVKDYSAGLDGSIKGFKIGVPRDFFYERLHPDVERAVLAAIAQLRDLGCEVRDVALPDMRAASDAWGTISVCEAYQVHEEHVRDHGADFGPLVLERLRLGDGVSANDYLSAQRHRDLVCRQMHDVMSDLDALVTPTSVMPGVSVETGNYDGPGGFFDGPRLLARFTRLACFTGQPAISLPCGLSSEGLPIGLQLIGKRFADDRVLQLAHGYELATEFPRLLP